MLVEVYNTSVQKGEEEREWKEDNLHLPSQTRMERSEDCVTIVSTVTYSCQANFPIRVYNGKHVKDGAAAAGALGGVAGAAGGATAGTAIGAAVGTVVPVAGNIIGGVVGGIIGGVVGLVGGGFGGAGTSAGVGAAVSNDQYVSITAREVFQELPQFREKDNIVFCELTTSSDSELSTTVYTSQGRN